MDLTSGIIELSMSMKAVEFQQNYSVALQKKVMDVQELAAQELVEMMPEAAVQAPVVPKGEFIDVYA